MKNWGREIGYFKRKIARIRKELEGWLSEAFDQDPRDIPARVAQDLLHEVTLMEERLETPAKAGRVKTKTPKPKERRNR